MSLSIDNISLNLDGNSILENISFSIKSETSLVIVGSSGSGKTKLLEVIAGLEKQNSGTIIFNKKNISQMCPSKRNFAMMFQDYALFPHLTIKDNIAYGLNAIKCNEKIKEQRLSSITKELKIDHILDNYPSQLSGGQQQRVALARCLVLRPDILLCDEPFSALDTSTRERISHLIKEMQRKYKFTLLFVTHNHDEARFMGDSILVLDNGRIEQIGTAEEIFFYPKSRCVAHFTATRNILPATITNIENCIATINSGIEFHSASFPSDKKNVWACIRPENVWISKKKDEKNNVEKNNHIFTITSIRPHSGVSYCITLQNKISLISLVPKTYVDQKNINIGDNVLVSITSDKIHCIPRKDDEYYCR